MSDAVKVAFIISVAPTLAAIFGMVVSLRNKAKLDKLSVEIDGRLTELLRVSKIADHALGVKEERERERNGKER